MSAPSLTLAQKRGLAWLPRDGSWRTKASSFAPAINSLSLRYQGTVEQKWGQFGKRGGWMSGYRLTEKGVALFGPLFEPTET